MVRGRQCRQCGTMFTTIEVPVDLPFYRLNVKGREENRLRMRRKRGYVGTHHSAIDPPRVVVEVHVYDKKRPAAST